ncbi:unnamed protein product [Clonostachys chloroleuca]|uniref:Probable beta-glucosidase G n=1 Tax=Clonostachys chloroleuca TaxID=1926264 RepID=A0AA35MIS9_9HYPO|nr:unnamed protein product [Clonostachys chloroleuca]
MRINQVCLAVAAVGTAKGASSPKFTSASAQRAEEFVSQLTVDEKLGIVSGGYSQPSPACVGSIGAIPRPGFEGICFSDGPAGYARSGLVSVFAPGITVAASWDVDLVFKRGVALGEEFRGKGAHVHLGPYSGPIGRHVAGGRNWESFGPDPYLAGVAMNASVLGIQPAGVQACSKHYIGNEQELQRTSTVGDDGTVTEAISSNIDNRTLHELYAWPFANAIQAGTAELDFRGYVVSDWYATHGTASFANAGLKIEMPGNTTAVAGSHYFGDALLRMVQNGTVTTDRLTDMAERVLRPYFLLSQDEDFPTVDPSGGAVFLAYQIGHKAQPHLGGYPMLPSRNVRGNHKVLIRELGAAATVLLKNVNNTLPMKNNNEVGMFGNAISYPTVGSTFRDADQYPEGYKYDTVDIGGGSGTEIGNSIADVLWGASLPSGRLPYTIPKTLKDYGPPIFNLTTPPVSPDAWQTNFTEGLMIDYRHFDANDIEPQYEFGFGLTYAKLELEGEVNLQVSGTLTPTADKSKGTAPGGLKDLWTVILTVDVQVKNSGKVDGHVVPQLYVAFPQDTTPAQTPAQVLRGFHKVFIKSVETSMVRFLLLRRYFSFWDEKSDQWVIPNGDFTFNVGFSSRDKAALQATASLL